MAGAKKEGPMKSINRNAVVLNAKQPFLDWILSLPGEFVPISLEELRLDCSVYLVPEGRDNEEAMQYLQKHCVEVFEQELLGWDEDESTWPPRPNWRSFKKWFDVKFHSMILDLHQDEIDRGDL